ncbi:hypothetical protein [Rhizosphaericola mali]|uniref:Uncharacterized protein n=1 Tax=Rhizosphaericola mali TaxID=2545455 RepID=A0A5P2G021_9BACT|nr:hypothetical protein [Rhizosphaericola mali]QES88835.1 hypothetical protein E0W69_009275 [Rhizosphaericola mali]
MNYIELIRGFWRSHDVEAFPTNVIALYFYLIEVNNKTSWIPSFKRNNAKICADLSISFPTLNSARNRLKQAGLIDFKTQSGNANVSYSLKNIFKVANEVTSEVSNEVSNEVSLRLDDTKDKLKTKTETINNNPNGLGDFTSPRLKSFEQLQIEKEKELYRSIPKNKESVFKFLKDRPNIVDPYFDFWNMFASETGRPMAKKLTDTRRKKLRTRIRDKDFDMGEIFRKAKSSELLSTSKWFTLDWIIDNEKNYLKVLEGNYDNEKFNKNGHTDSTKSNQEFETTLERQKRNAGQI